MVCQVSKTSNAPRLKPSRRPFEGNSRSYTPQPSVLKGVQACRLPALKRFKPFKPSRRPFQGNSCSYTPQPSAFKAVQACRLPALKPVPATIACLCLGGLPSFKGLIQGCSSNNGLSLFKWSAKSQRPQTRRGSSHDQTLPQAFRRQLSQLHAPAICFSGHSSHGFFWAVKPAVR